MLLPAPRRLRVALISLFLLLLGVNAYASTVLGTVSVQGPGAPIAPISGASIVAVQKNKVVASAVSDGAGHYSFYFLAAGSYTLRFTKDNFLEGDLNNYYL